MAKKQTKKTARWKRKKAYRDRKKREAKEAFIKTLLFRRFRDSELKPEPENKTDYSFCFMIENIILHHKELMDRPREILFRKFNHEIFEKGGE